MKTAIQISAIIILFFSSCDSMNQQSTESETSSQSEETTEPNKRNEVESEEETQDKNISLDDKKISLVGKQYLLKYDEYTSFNYDRTYSKQESVYQTIYLNYNPRSGKPVHKIIVTHDIKADTIGILVKAAFDGIFAPEDINYQVEVTPDLKSKGTFGIKGFENALEGNAPHQILLRFADEDYKYANILEVRVNKSGDAEWYFLDQ